MFVGALEPTIGIDIVDAIRRFVHHRIASAQLAELVVILTSVLFALLVCVAVDFLFRRVVRRWIEKLIKRSPVKWDDLFLKWHVFDRLAPWVPALAF